MGHSTPLSQGTKRNCNCPGSKISKNPCPIHYGRTGSQLLKVELEPRKQKQTKQFGTQKVWGSVTDMRFQSNQPTIRPSFPPLEGVEKRNAHIQ